MQYITLILTLGGLLVGIWATIKYVILVEIRIDNNTFRTLYELIQKEPKFILEEEHFSEKRHPVTLKCICFPKNTKWFYLFHGERLLQAGFQGKDAISYIVCLRVHQKNIKNFLVSTLPALQLEQFGVPIRIATPWNTDKIGSVRDFNEPVFDKSFYQDIESDIESVIQGKLSKTSAILYGEPGNGKTSLIKYFAAKYKLPVLIITFTPEYTNMDIMFMFSQIDQDCIVLLEDFDNYFDKRKCIIGESNSGGNNMGIKFTFDSILNCLDGVYNHYKKTVFFMTANDIEKIDSALKNRPSRFKFIKYFGNPDTELRRKLLGDWCEHTSDFNLDQIFRLKEAKENGLPLHETISKMRN